MTNKYRDALLDMPDRELPRNPCKFMRVWRDQSKEAYDEIMEGAIFSRDDEDVLFDLEKVAAMLTEEMGISISKADIAKHRNGQCLGCVKMAGKQ